MSNYPHGIPFNIKFPFRIYFKPPTSPTFSATFRRRRVDVDAGKTSKSCVDVVAEKNRIAEKNRKPAKIFAPIFLAAEPFSEIFRLSFFFSGDPVLGLTEAFVMRPGYVVDSRSVIYRRLLTPVNLNLVWDLDYSHGISLLLNNG